MADGLSAAEAMALVFAEFGAASLDLEMQPGEFTAAQYATMHGIHYNKARQQLDAAVEAGRLTVRTVVFDGHRCKGYRVNTT